MWAGKRERERERERIPSSLHTVSTELHTGLELNEPWYCDLSRNQESIAQPAEPPRCPQNWIFVIWLQIHDQFPPLQITSMITTNYTVNFKKERSSGKKKAKIREEKLRMWIWCPQWISPYSTCPFVFFFLKEYSANKFKLLPVRLFASWGFYSQGGNNRGMRGMLEHNFLSWMLTTSVFWVSSSRWSERVGSGIPCRVRFEIKQPYFQQLWVCVISGKTFSRGGEQTVL